MGNISASFACSDKFRNGSWYCLLDDIVYELVSLTLTASSYGSTVLNIVVRVSVYLSVCLSVGPVSKSHSLLILGWCSSLPRASAMWTLDSVPMFKFLFVIPSVMVLVQGCRACKARYRVVRVSI